MHFKGTVEEESRICLDHIPQVLLIQCPSHTNNTLPYTAPWRCVHVSYEGGSAGSSKPGWEDQKPLGGHSRVGREQGSIKQKVLRCRGREVGGWALQQACWNHFTGLLSARPVSIYRTVDSPEARSPEICPTASQSLSALSENSCVLRVWSSCLWWQSWQVSWWGQIEKVLSKCPLHPSAPWFLAQTALSTFY